MGKNREANWGPKGEPGMRLKRDPWVRKAGSGNRD